MVNFITAVLLILFAAFSRLLPHPMNFAPVAAIALFAGSYLNKKYAFIIPVAALLISDAILGFYNGIEWVYGSFLLIGLIGIWQKSRIENAGAARKTIFVASTALVSSILFFVITNFGMWTSGFLYERTFSGLVLCYTMAIPFFRNTLAGDMVYVAVMFGVYELVTRLAGKQVLQTSKIGK